MVGKCIVKHADSNENITDRKNSKNSGNHLTKNETAAVCPMSNNNTTADPTTTATTTTTTANNNNNNNNAKSEANKEICIYLWLKDNPDLDSIILLILLYIIQGLPFGLSTAIPVKRLQGSF